MRKTKLQYHYAVRKLKRNSDVLRKEKMAEALNENNSRNFWNEVKKVNDNRIQYPSHVDNINNASDIASLFASKYEALYNSVPSNKTLLNEIYKNLDSDIRNINIHDMQISEVHIVKAFQKIKNDKADSEHKLFSNHLKYAPVSLYRYLACLFNGMIVHGYTPPCIINSNIISIPKDTRGNLSSSENYRGVSLCSSIFKIFELVLIQLQGHNLFTSEMQFAYKEGHSTTMSTLVLKEIANHFINKGSNVYCCFIDASKAFDRLRHDLLFDILYKRGVNPLMIRILMNTFQNQTVQTSWAGIQSKKFTCQNGVRQGGILSPLLYSIYNDILLERLKTNGNGCWMGNHYFGALSYADDLCILSPTLSGLENMLNVCEKYGKEFDVIYNPKKTQCMKFTRDTSGVKFKSDISLCGQNLEWVDSVKYLGNWITYNLKETVEINKKMCAFYGNVNSLRTCFRNVGYKNISKLFNSYCCHFYGSQAWCLRDKEIKRLYTAWNKSVRHLCTLPYDTHTQYLPYIINTLYVKEQIYIRTANMILSMLNSGNASMSFLTSYNLYNQTSIIGENWNLIHSELDIDIFDKSTKHYLIKKQNN
jgi:hypothetical protein